MKIVVTGSLGNIGKPLTEELAGKGHQVVVVSSKDDKRKEIEALGATAAIGSVEDVEFLSSIFSGADAVYCMVPPNFFAEDQVAYYTKVGNSYVKAITDSGVKRVILLSSYGAHLSAGTGVILGAHHAESIFSALTDVDLTIMRPGYFYYNLFNFTGIIRAAGFIASNYGDNDKLLLVSPLDIARAIADEITSPSPGIRIRYVVSDDRTCNEVAEALGKSIGLPDLTWKVFTDEQTFNGMTANGVPKHMAENLTELGTAIHSGILREDYDKHQTVTGKVKIDDFAKEFAQAYSSNKSAH